MKFNYITVIGIIASLVIGYFLNDYANKKNNKRLIAELKAELEQMNKTKTSATTTRAEQVQIELKEAKINGQIACLESQL